MALRTSMQRLSFAAGRNLGGRGAPILAPGANRVNFHQQGPNNNTPLGHNTLLHNIHANQVQSNNILGGNFPVPSALSSAMTMQKRFYDEKVLDHFAQPRNVGTLDKKKQNVGTAVVGKASCGDVIKMSIEVDDDGKIKDAKFKTFGCGSAIASSSLATEMVIGKSLDEAGELKNTDIASYLNLPPVKIHCSVLAEESIQGAIKDYKEKNVKA